MIPIIGKSIRGVSAQQDESVDWEIQITFEDGSLAAFSMGGDGRPEMLFFRDDESRGEMWPLEMVTL